jgi:hypothetical protein
MHLHTFLRLMAEHDALIGKYLVGMTQRFEGVDSFVD